MVSVAEISDQDLRKSLADAETALDEGDYPRSVRCSVAAYCELIEQRPDMIIAPRLRHSFSPPQGGAGGGGLVMGGPRPWPSDHGVHFDMDEGQKPSLTFAKERFTLSEAATYFEYTLDMVLRAQRHPA
jgi:hypothetical protein